MAARTGLPVAWVRLYSGYLLYVAKEYGGTVFQDVVLGGPLLSRNAGGFIAKRSVHDWLYGADVILCSKQSIKVSTTQLLYVLPFNKSMRF